MGSDGHFLSMARDDVAPVALRPILLVTLDDSVDDDDSNDGTKGDETAVGP
jgi:hypothetical protein